MPFEFNGEKYTKASAHQKEWGAQLVADLPLNGREHILDLGCGDGALTALLASRVPAGFVLGIDASRNMIETALAAHRSDNLTFELADINNLGYVNRFDVIFSNAALHWVKDHRQLLTHVHSALKKNGIVRFNFAGAGNCSNFYNVIQQVMRLPRFASYFEDFIWPWYMPTPEEYRELASHSLLTEIRIWEENADRYFPDQETMTRWIDQPSIVPFLQCVGTKDKKDFRDTVVAQMTRVTLQPDNTCFETFRRLNLFARKV